jgi:hypothetical protein
MKYIYNPKKKNSQVGTTLVTAILLGAPLQTGWVDFFFFFFTMEGYKTNFCKNLYILPY